MLTPFFQFSFLCMVALANLCLGFAIASRLGYGPPLGLLFQLESTGPSRPPELTELESNDGVVEEPVADAKPVGEIDDAAPDEPTAEALTTEASAASPQEDVVLETAEA